MQNSKRIVIAIAFMLIGQLAMNAVVKVELLKDQLKTNVVDTDYRRQYFYNSYIIKVENAKGHKLRMELQLLDANGNNVYMDADVPAFNSVKHTVDSDNDTIEGWVGLYYDTLLLKSGPQKVNFKLKLFDETTDSYITPFDSTKHFVSYTSTKPNPGIVVRNKYIEQGSYDSYGHKCMKVCYRFDANWYKDKKIKVVVQLYKANGTPIYYSNGELAKTTELLTADHTLSSWNDRWSKFAYAGLNIKIPTGSTKITCYAKIHFYDATTGKALPTTGSNKIDFIVHK